MSRTLCIFLSFKKKNQSKRLTEQHKESHGVIGIFGEGLADVANAGEEDKNKTE